MEISEKIAKDLGASRQRVHELEAMCATLEDKCSVLLSHITGDECPSCVRGCLACDYRLRAENEQLKKEPIIPWRSPPEWVRLMSENARLRAENARLETFASLEAENARLKEAEQWRTTLGAEIQKRLGIAPTVSIGNGIRGLFRNATEYQARVFGHRVCEIVADMFDSVPK